MIDFKTRTRTPSVVAILAAGTLLFAATETALARNGGHSGDRGAMNNHNRNRGMANADSHRTRDRGERLSQKQANKEKISAKRLEKHKVAEKSANKVSVQSKDKGKTAVTTASTATPAPVTGGTTTSAPASGSTTASASVSGGMTTSAPTNSNANPAAVVFNRPLPGIGGNHPLPGTGGTNTIHPIVGGNANATAAVNSVSAAADKAAAAKPGFVFVNEEASITTRDIPKALYQGGVSAAGILSAPVAIPTAATIGLVKGGLSGAVKEVKSVAKKFLKIFEW